MRVEGRYLLGRISRSSSLSLAYVFLSSLPALIPPEVGKSSSQNSR